MMVHAHTTTTDEQVTVPAPRTPTARPATVPMTVRAAGARQDRGEHLELVAARLVSQAAVVSLVGRLAVLLALGLLAWFLLLP
ncbi:hypothetical protein [Actinomycetospora aeridis]|uniref:Uncharacterized protein n=1 Tax=Actinomycetospora aeridis TaxID=3129231 RepID=A0ABU8NCQ9_9PSEU